MAHLLCAYMYMNSLPWQSDKLEALLAEIDSLINAQQLTLELITNVASGIDDEDEWEDVSSDNSSDEASESSRIIGPSDVEISMDTGNEEEVMHMICSWKVFLTAAWPCFSPSGRDLWELIDGTHHWNMSAYLLNGFSLSHPLLMLKSPPIVCVGSPYSISSFLLAGLS